MTACEGCPNGGQVCWGNGPSPCDIIICGESPGRQEARKHVPFVGPSGQLVNAVLTEHGLERSQVYVDNVVACRTVGDNGKDAPPPTQAVDACSERLRSSILAVRPKVVLALGTTAAQRLLKTKAKIGDIAGAIEYSEEFQTFIIPTFHPAAILRGALGYFDNLYTSTKRAAEFATGKAPLPNRNYHVDWEYVDDPERAYDILDNIRKRSLQEHIVLSVDSESNGAGKHEQLRPMDHTWDMVQIYVPWVGKSYSFNVHKTLGRVRSVLCRLLESDSITWIMHNSEYDQRVFRYNLGVMARNVQDTMVLGLGLSERGEDVGLKALSRHYLNAPFYEKDLQVSFQTGPQNQDEWLSLAKYGAFDAYNTYQLGRILPPLVRAEGTMPLCKNLLLPAQDCFATLPGTNIDLEYVEGLEAEWVPLIEKAEKDLQDWAYEQGFPQDPSVVGNQKLAKPCPDCVDANIPWEPVEPRKQWRSQLSKFMGDPSCKTCRKRRYVFEPDLSLNVRSSRQIQHLAFDVLGMHNPEGRSCDKGFLEYNKGTDLVTRIEDFRKKDFLLSHYVRGIAGCVWSDGKVHPDFLIFGTRTGRLAVQNPACQTLPKWNVDPELARSIRRMFVPSPGHVLVESDYKNLEMFVAHAYSHDENLLEALTKYDFHQRTASFIFDKPYEEVTGEERQTAKPVNFGILYGRTAHALALGELADITGGDERIAQRFIDKWWESYPKLHACYLEWQRQGVEDGEVVSLLGRKRRWRLITPDNVDKIKNEASNHPIQSLASDLCLSAMIRLNKKLPALGLGNVLLSIHDSILAEIREDRLEEGVNLIVKEMETPPFETDTPFSVDVQVGRNLGEMVKYSQ